MYFDGNLHISAFSQAKTRFTDYRLMRMEKTTDCAFEVHKFIDRYREGFRPDLKLNDAEITELLAPHRNGLSQDEFETLCDVMIQNLPYWQIRLFDTSRLYMSVDPLN